MKLEHDLGYESRAMALTALLHVKAMRGYPLGDPLGGAREALSHHYGEPVIVMRLSEAIEKKLIKKKRGKPDPTGGPYAEYDLSALE